MGYPKLVIRFKIINYNIANSIINMNINQIRTWNYMNGNELHLIFKSKRDLEMNMSKYENFLNSIHDTEFVYWYEGYRRIWHVPIYT